MTSKISETLATLGSLACRCLELHTSCSIRMGMLPSNSQQL